MRLLSGLAAVVFALAIGRSAGAQTSPSPPKWELEMYGGVSLGRISSGGSLALPPPGPPIPTSNPVYPSWRVPTWFLGDGASYLNRVAQELGVAARIAPLDSALNPAATNDTGSFAFGARVRRPLRGRFSVEGGVDVLLNSGGVTQDLINASAASSDSFQQTFSQILATGPFTGTAVTATATPRDGSSREITLTGALVMDFSPFRGFVPFAVMGGGVIMQSGEAPGVDLEGRYRFFIDGVAPFDERDRLTVDFSGRTTFVGVLGGGVQRPLSPRWHLRIDARVLLGPSTSRVAFDAHPEVATATPARFIETFTYPNLQFSNNPSTNRESTLSGTLDGFDAFTGGWQTRFRLTAGLVVRF
jgi:hypothetical protein